MTIYTVDLIPGLISSGTLDTPIKRSGRSIKGYLPAGNTMDLSQESVLAETTWKRSQRARLKSVLLLVLTTIT